MISKIFKSNLTKSVPTKSYFSATPQYNFSTAPKINFDIYLQENQAKRFYIDRNTNLDDLSRLLRREDDTIQSIKFKLGDEEVSGEGANVIQSVLLKNVKIEVNRQNVPIHIDLNGPIGYHSNSQIDDFLAENEVPINDALLISSFTNVYKSILQQKYPTRKTYTITELTDALDDAIASFKNMNEKSVSEINTNLDQLVEDYRSDLGKYQQLVEEVKAKATGRVKYLVYFLLAQFGILFYLTYYSVGWDVTEPISYLLALAMEGWGIYVIVKHSRSYDQSLIFDRAMKLYKSQMTKNFSLNPAADLYFSNRRINYLKQRVQYTKTVDPTDVL